MKKVEEIGTCPNCDCSICIFKTNNYKRFAKCEICGLSYALPKKGMLSSSGLICPSREFPILIVEIPHQKAYFWADQPCFACVNFDKCDQVKILTKEFEELQVYGY